MSRLLFKTGIVSLLVAHCSWPVHSAAGTEGVSFLNIPVGAGPASLASAYTALATDAYAPVYNPAGLGFLDSTQVAAQHLSYLGSTHYEFFSAVHPFLSGSGLGLSVQYLGSGDMTQTDANGVDFGKFSASFASYNVSYGQKIRESVSLGMTLKWIHARLSDVGADAFAADLGVFYQPIPRWNLASTLTNVGSHLTFLSEGDDLPLTWHTATSWQVLRQVKVTGEAVYRRAGISSVHAGLEWQALPMAAWRIGSRTDTLEGLDEMSSLTTGVGFQWRKQELAYAWVPLGELGNTHYFSLLMRFGESRESKRNLIHYGPQKTRAAQNKTRSSVPDADYDSLMHVLDEPSPPPPKKK